MIPRLVDSAGQAAPPGGGGVGGADLDPTNWSVEEVSTFLEINECSTLAGAFSEQVLCQLESSFWGTFPGGSKGSARVVCCFSDIENNLYWLSLGSIHWPKVATINLFPQMPLIQHQRVHPRLNLAFNAFQICSYYVFISNFRKLTGTDSWPWWRKTSWSSLTTKLDLAWRSKTSSGFWRLEWTRLRQGFKPPWHESLRSLPSALNAFPVRLVPTATYCCLS